MTCRPERWLLGLPLLATIGVVAIWRGEPEIEHSLAARLSAPEAAVLAEGLARRGARVDLDGRDLSVVTDADLSPDARADIERLAALLPGLRRVVTRLEPSRVARPFRFEVSRTGSGLVLAGSVPPGEARAELLAQAKAAAGGEAARDELHGALGAPASFSAGAAMVIRLAGLLKDSRASLTDEVFELEGVAPDPAAYNEVLAILRAPPPGLSPGLIQVTPPLVDPFVWLASRTGDSLTLEGSVPSEAARSALISASSAAGMAADDRMQTARGLSGGIDFDATAKRAVTALARLDRGRVSLQGQVLTVDGETPARDDLREIEREFRQSPHRGIELGPITLRAIPASPYRISAERKNGRVLLAGYVPGEAEKLDVAGVAARRFPFEAVANGLRVADGAPDNLLPAFRLALDRLSLLAEGEARITDRNLRLVGRSLYPELAGRMRRDFAAALPPGWSGSIEVKAEGPEKPLDPRFCEDLLNDAVRREPIRFEAGRADLDPAGSKGLSGAADVLRRCGTARFAVVASVGSMPDPNAAREIARKRATAVVESLKGLAAGAELQPEAAGQPIATGEKPPSDHVAFEARP